MGWVVSIVNGSGKHTLLHVSYGQGARCLENPHHILHTLRQIYVRVTTKPG